MSSSLYYKELGNVAAQVNAKSYVSKSVCFCHLFGECKAKTGSVVTLKCP